jgi:hypothetical protein
MKLPITITTLFASLSLAADIRTIYQFPNPTWLENIAPMRNGSLLVSVVGRPEVHIVNPTSEPATSFLIAIFPSANAVFGITELSRNIFTVGVGNVTPANAPILGSFAVWTLDLTGAVVIMKKVATTPGMINGVEKLNSHTVLLADSWNGNIIKIDTHTGSSSVILDDPVLKPNFSDPVIALGVNGIHVHKNWLYYTNTALSILGRVKIDTDTAELRGPFTTIASGSEIAYPDDFSVDTDGSVVLARPFADVVQHAKVSGAVEMVAKVPGGTRVVFAKDKENKRVMYATLSGLEGSVPSSGGKVVAITMDEGKGRGKRMSKRVLQ